MSEKFDFEGKLNRLEEIVQKLDDSDGNIEELLDQYKEGMSIASELKKFIETSKQKITEIENSFKPESDD